MAKIHTIKIANLKKIYCAVVDHLGKIENSDEFNSEFGYYWHMSPQEQLNAISEPMEIALSDLNSEIKNLNKAAKGEISITRIDLATIGAILIEIRERYSDFMCTALMQDKDASCLCERNMPIKQEMAHNIITSKTNSIKIVALKELYCTIFDHVEKIQGSSHFKTEFGYYWCITPEQQFNSLAKPIEMTLGDLNWDIEDLESAAQGKKPIMYTDLTSLSTILTEIQARYSDFMCTVLEETSQNHAEE